VAARGLVVAANFRFDRGVLAAARKGDEEMTQTGLLSHYKRCTSLLVLLCLLAGACGPQPSAVTPQPTEVVQVAVDTPIPPGDTPPLPTDTPVPTTDTPTPAPTAAPTATPMPLPPATPEPSIEQAEDGGAASDAAALLEADITAIEATIVEEPWSFQNYHYLHDARLEMAARLPLDELDEEIAGTNQAIAENEKDAEAYYQRGMAKYQRTVLSHEPADVEGPFNSYRLNLEHAIADLNRAIELDPDYAEAYHLRGLAYHLQGLEYIGIALVECDPTDIDQAIADYDRAIALNPDMSSAYHDRGTAYAHRGWQVGSEADDMPEQVFQDLRQAVLDLTSAIDREPDSESTYLNRAFTNLLLSTDLENTGQDAEGSIQQWLDDSTKVIELNPENMWGYLLRGFAYGSAQESAEESAAAQLESQANDDLETFDTLAGDLLQRYQLMDLGMRLLTLSSGPPIDPRAALPGLLGTLEDDVYTSPDGRLRLQVPDLMQPNAVIWDEMASSGDLMVWFEDDLARWYALQVHPGTLGEESLEEWVGVNVAHNLDVQEEYQTDTPLGTAIVLVHRYAEPEGDCATALAHHDEHFYAASYCLLDHYAGEDEAASIRTFGFGYGIDYEPVDALAEELIRGLEIPSDSK
jgi:tetratricopeptide (TPR) repeat protein